MDNKPVGRPCKTYSLRSDDQRDKPVREGRMKDGKSVRPFKSLRLMLMRQRPAEEPVYAKDRRELVHCDRQLAGKVSSEIRGRISRSRVEAASTSARSPMGRAEFGAAVDVMRGIPNQSAKAKDCFSAFFFPVTFSCKLNDVEETLPHEMARKICDNDAIRDCAAYLANGGTEKVRLRKYEESYQNDVGRVDLTIIKEGTHGAQPHKFNTKNYKCSLNLADESVSNHEVERMMASYLEGQGSELSDSLKILLGQGLLNQLYAYFSEMGLKLSCSGSSSCTHILELNDWRCVLKSTVTYNEYINADGKAKKLKLPCSFSVMISLGSLSKSGNWRLNEAKINLNFHGKVARVVERQIKPAASRRLLLDIEEITGNAGGLLAARALNDGGLRRCNSDDSLLSTVSKKPKTRKTYFKKGFLLKDNKVFLCDTTLSKYDVRWQLSKFNWVSEYNEGLIIRGIQSDGNHAGMEEIVVRCSNLLRWYPSGKKQFFDFWLEGNIDTLKNYGVSYLSALKQAVLAECRCLWNAQFQEYLDKYLNFNYQDYAGQVFPELSLQANGSEFLEIAVAICKSQENTSNVVAWVKALNDIRQELMAAKSLSNSLCAEYLLKLGKAKAGSFSIVASYRGCPQLKHEPARELVPYFNRFSTGGQKLVSILLYENMNRLKVLCKASWVGHYLTTIEVHNNPHENDEFVNNLSRDLKLCIETGGRHMTIV
ncbi:hypothetical protein [Salinisphaera sp. G21_0]|uniref:hypothetical protein n=1 Tax=Salinisphaera sp. G21_0 TaxID=2821094 RepID=UPI001ADB4705|nr:hypothetical protein [Salinisphaera sp. G21_0]MBO9482932.1 hypothetical protein [Salinisphaera sp. G21_0]